MSVFKSLYFLVIGTMLLAACAPAGAGPGSPPGTSTPPTSTPQDLPLQVAPLVQAAAQRAVADKLGITPDQVRVAGIVPVEWPDSCLGVGSAVESCLAAVTPGYRVTLEAQGQAFEIHTNQDGSVIRFANGVQQPVQVPVGNVLSERLSQQLGINPQQVEIISVEQVQFPDGCLGYARPDEMCTMIITPGYKVVLRANGKEYEYHTDLQGTFARTPDGTQIDLLGSTPQVKDVPMLVFRTIGQACDQARIRADTVDYGPCVGQLMSGDLPSGRAEELKILQSTYSSFNAKTQAGLVEFSGQGSRAPSAAEQRSIAAWGSLVLEAMYSGRGSAAQGLALAWHREGGIAGFCDDLSIYLSGFATASSCKSQQPVSYGVYRLNAEQIDQLYRYIDTFQRFELQQKDPAQADAMTIQLTFEGTGAQAAAATTQEEISGFAAGIYTQVPKK